MKIALQGAVDSVTPGGVDYSLYLAHIIAHFARKIKRKNTKKLNFYYHRLAVRQCDQKIS